MIWPCVKKQGAVLEKRELKCRVPFICPEMWHFPMKQQGILLGFGINIPEKSRNMSNISCMNAEIHI